MRAMVLAVGDADEHVGLLHAGLLELRRAGGVAPYDHCVYGGDLLRRGLVGLDDGQLVALLDQ
jgi:hypothetical protein